MEAHLMAKQVTLININLGPLDADHDENLMEYFVDFGSFDDLQTKSKFIVVGSKGTGKSAVRRYLSQHRRINNLPIVEIEDSYSLAISDAPIGSIAQTKNYMLGVLIGLVIQGIFECEHIHGNRKIRLRALENDISIIKRLISTTKLKPPYAEIALEELFSKGKKPDLIRLTSEQTISTIARTLSDDDLWILIDDVDSIFTSQNENDSLTLLASLIFASSDINMRLLKSNVFIVLLLRAEIYEKLIKLETATDLDKNEKYLWHLSWTRDELINFLASRLRWAFDLNDDVSSFECWRKLFDTTDKINTQELQYYIIDRLINGPRDLLLLVDKARIAAMSSGSEKITMNHIIDSEQQYGKITLQHITRSFQGIYPSIDLIIDKVFRGQPQIYTRAQLESHLNERLLTNPAINLGFGHDNWFRRFTPYRFIETLYIIGFIGYKDRSTQRFIYTLEESNPEFTLVESKDFKIHSAFTKFLELVT